MLEDRGGCGGGGEVVDDRGEELALVVGPGEGVVERGELREGGARRRGGAGLLRFAGLHAGHFMPGGRVAGRGDAARGAGARVAMALAGGLSLRAGDG